MRGIHAIMGHAKQPHPFDPRKAALLDDPQREAWLPTEVVLKHLEIWRGARVLDYGTGTARYAIAIARANPASTIVAFDIQPQMLEIATTRVRESGVRTVAVVGPGDDAMNGRFDRILALNVLHELEDTDLRKLHAMLAPDGFALFIDWNAAVARECGPPGEHTHTISDATRLLENARFRVDSLPESRFPYHYRLRARA